MEWSGLLFVGLLPMHMPSLDHILHHAPNDLLSVFGAGIGIALIATAALRLLSTTRGKKV
jgi:hypothetical protein